MGNSLIQSISLQFALQMQAFFSSIAKSGWSTEGVRTESVTREGDTVTVTCTSLHLTSFAVLVDVGGAQVQNI